MAKYRKKPVVVEAEVYKKGLEDGFTLEDWLPKEVEPENLVSFFVHEVSSVFEKDNNRRVYPYIKTLKGNHYISPGDYIITGVKGERYPCKPDVFENTYELVEE